MENYTLTDETNYKSQERAKSLPCEWLWKGAQCTFAAASVSAYKPALNLPHSGALIEGCWLEVAKKRKH